MKNFFAKKKRVKRLRNIQASDIILLTVTVLLALMILLPFFWLVLSSLKTNVEYYAQPSPFFSKDPQWSRYTYVFVELSFLFLSSWKDSMGPLIYLRSESLYTVPVALMFFQAPDQNSYLMLLTGVVISMIPTLVIYVCLQKWMDKGIYVADLK